MPAHAAPSWPRLRLTSFSAPSPGGKHYSRGLQPVDANGNQVSIWSADSRDRSAGEDDSDSDESSAQEGSGDEAATSKPPAAAEAKREDRKAEKKARREAALAKQRARTVQVGDLPSSDESSSDDDEDMPANPNHSKAARTMVKRDSDVEDMTKGVQDLKAPASRREREAVEAAEAKERYMRLQAQGKTDEAKADLARLKLIREQRAAEAARRQVCRRRRAHRITDGWLPRLTACCSTGGKGREGRAGKGATGRDRGQRGQEARGGGWPQEERQEKMRPTLLSPWRRGFHSRMRAWPRWAAMLCHRWAASETLVAAWYLDLYSWWWWHCRQRLMRFECTL